MEYLLHLDACMKGADSRTRQLAVPILQKLEARYVISTLRVQHMDTLITADSHARRVAEGPTEQDKAMAELVAKSDRIVISAPFWDMSFPACLKAFIERVSLNGYTFIGNPDGTTRGNCRAKKMLYITTRGMNIRTDDTLDQGTSYLRALCWLWGIDKLEVIAAHGQDLVDYADREFIYTSALDQGLLLAERF